MGLTGSSLFGTGARLAAGKESTWGTGVTVTDVIPFTSESISPEQVFLQSDYLAGRVGREIATASVQKAAGTVAFEPVIDVIAGDPLGWELILLAALGSGTWDAANSVTKYVPASTLPSLTLGIAKTVSVWEMAGAKVNSWEITGAFEQQLTGSADFVGRRVLRTGQSGITNTTTTIVTNLTPTAKPSLLDLKDGVFRIGTHGDALAAADKMGISSFTLRGNNALTDAAFATPEDTGGHTDATFSLEHVRNDYRSFELEIGIARYHEDTLLDWAYNGTALQCDLTFTVGSLYISFLLPYVKILATPTAPVDGPGAVQTSAVLTALVNGSTNTDMAFADATAITGEIGVEVKSNRTAAP